MRFAILFTYVAYEDKFSPDELALGDADSLLNSTRLVFEIVFRPLPDSESIRFMVSPSESSARPLLWLQNVVSPNPSANPILSPVILEYIFPRTAPSNWARDVNVRVSKSNGANAQLFLSYAYVVSAPKT